KTKEYEQKRKLLMTQQQGQQQSQGVIIKPDPMQQKSPFGVKTFGHTPKVQQPAPVDHAQTLDQQRQHQKELKQTAQMLPDIKEDERLLKQMNAWLSNPANQPNKVPETPMEFYYNIVKPMYGSSAKRFYRKYRLEFVSGMRVY